MNNKFDAGDIVLHKETSIKYVILISPSDNDKLEGSNEYYYKYWKVPKASGCYAFNTKWIRSKSEMEDGRFIKIEERK